MAGGGGGGGGAVIWKLGWVQSTVVQETNVRHTFMYNVQFSGRHSLKSHG